MCAGISVYPHKRSPAHGIVLRSSIQDSRINSQSLVAKIRIHRERYKAHQEFGSSELTCTDRDIQITTLKPTHESACRCQQSAGQAFFFLASFSTELAPWASRCYGSAVFSLGCFFCWYASEPCQTTRPWLRSRVMHRCFHSFSG